MNPSKKDIIGYDFVAQNLQASIPGEIDKKTMKSLNKIYKELDIDGKPLREKVAAIENHIKGNYFIQQISNPEYNDLSKVIGQQVLGHTGAKRFFAAMFDLAGIEYQMAITSSRNSLPFDKEFTAYIYLDHFLFYLPEEEFYIAPTSQMTRMEYIPYFWSENYGLFIKKVVVGDLTTAIAYVNRIKPLSYKATQHVLNIDVTIDKEDLPEISVDLRKEVTGYYAMDIQPIYEYLDEEKKKELGKILVKEFAQDIEVEKAELTNTGKNDFGHKPMILESAYTTDAFMAKAGPKFIFKIGELIGPQMEMYQEKERTLPLDSRFNRYYKRTINFSIPEGYTCNNLDALNMDVKKNEGEEDEMVFISSYEQDGDKVTVTVEEYYKQLIVPAKEFEAYRKVINAAADFNKIQLYLEKK